MEVQLTNRQQHILWATVRHYIATAEPVGSKALVDEYDLGVSSATIRNVMGVLEKSGLLYQPHTSAGRIPSDSGYRIYVDQLITPGLRDAARTDVLAKEVELALQNRLHWEDWSLEAVLQGAAQILATVSGCISLITMPQTTTAILRHLQLMQIEANKIMLIVVTDDYETHSKLMNLSPTEEEAKLDADGIDHELKIVSNFLNTHLRGRSLLELATLDWSDLDQEFQRYGEFLKGSVTELTRRHLTPTTTQIMVRGVAEVLRQPEFSQLQQVQTIIQLLEEEQDQLWRLIFAEPETEEAGKSKVTVRIGTENPLEPIRTCTLITSTYRRGLLPVGSVGVLGPTRLDYDSAIAVVAAAADYLSDAFS
ncbi:heat-inducible transcriptional repressor HrcA [Nodularia spumigena CS-584]|jgi:heat-inducible transcriptional repressor|uniref:Heat-inducible transcription repressor HrcA n=2 Tax=Nodularia spumigena TaxID=70799 RepID=HRCA_NODSP|nr:MULTISPECIES: heat-inducible transcriptional repressor HrcA [Cyanophyceae]Q84B70.1 RecName: Full=Heat-inducible transcription repressor HrcA [Nodularia spumigena]MDB9355145.1 heat-inducible transcriptional repressor HrcA [Nodularia spumigena CS-587/03]AAO39777.2 putative heat transcriptional repressor protein [Nodularia spumigena]AHJ30509.1 Heat-inducible transcription repressor HrcA [Nodularia spumigena CCY9414]EAW43074.1 heat-inducible transcription repressor [Nodularia spumigena CCY9414]